MTEETVIIPKRLLMEIVDRLDRILRLCRGQVDTSTPKKEPEKEVRS